MQLVGGKWRAKKSFIIYLESKGWPSGESTRLPPMWPGFKSWRRRHMWVEFVVGSLLCSERFFSGYSGFPISPKTNISKFQFDQESGRRRTTLFRDVLPPNHFIHLFIFVLFSLKSIAGAHAHCCQGKRGNFQGELESFRNYKGLSIIFPIILDAI